MIYKSKTQNLDKLPFRNIKCWLLFDSIIDADGREKKMPLHPLTKESKGWNNTEFLSTYQETIEQSENYYLGIGSHGLKNIIILDLDQCFYDTEDNILTGNRLLKSWAKVIVDFALSKGCFIEYSKSRNGLHIIFECNDLPVNEVHTKHNYGKVNIYGIEKSVALEIFYNTNRNLLLCGELYEPAYNHNIELPVIEAKEFIKVLTDAKANKILQTLSKKEFTRRKATPKEQSAYFQDSNINHSDILKLALCEDGIKFLFNFEDNYSNSFSDLKNAYPYLSEKFYDSCTSKTASENDYLFVLMLTKYTLDRELLIDILLKSPRALEESRNKKMNESHSSDGRTYSQLTVDKAIENALDTASNVFNNNTFVGDSVVSRNIGIKWMNSKYYKSLTRKETLIVQVVKSESGLTIEEYTQAAVKDSMLHMKICSLNSNKEPITASLFDVWMNSREAKLVNGINFNPNKFNKSVPLYFDNDRCFLNSYLGFAIEPDSTKPIDKWLFHVKEVICNGDLEDYEYLINTFAYIIQNPGELSGVANVFKSKQGIGKNLLLNPIKKILGSLMYQVHDERDIVGQFNSIIEGKLIIVVNEAMFAGNKKEQKILKGLITDEDFSINKKFVTQYQTHNYVRLFILSNEDSVIHYENAERRYKYYKSNVKYSTEYRNKNKDFDIIADKHFTDLLDEFGDNGKGSDCAKGLLHFFLNRDISKFNPRKFDPSKNAGAIRNNSLCTNSILGNWFVNFLAAGCLYFEPSNSAFSKFESESDKLKSSAAIGKVSFDLEDDLYINPHTAYKSFCDYQAKFNPRKGILDESKFKALFADLFLNGSQKTFNTYFKGNQIRYWNLNSTRKQFCIKLEIEPDSD